MEGATGRPLDGPAPAALGRRPIERVLGTGVRVIDGLLTLGEGQRVGLFAGSGVGKSTLLGEIARGTTADVVVVALVGERGREVGEFLTDTLGEAGRSKSVVVVATSDAPALERLRAAQAATAIAEHFRDEGMRVLLLVDSVTRFARAQREVGLAAGSRRRGGAIHRVCSRCFPGCWSGPDRGPGVRSPPSIRCWSKEGTWMSRSLTRFGASWMGTSYWIGRGRRGATTQRSTCFNRCPG